MFFFVFVTLYYINQSLKQLHMLILSYVLLLFSFLEKELSIF